MSSPVVPDCHASHAAADNPRVVAAGHDVDYPEVPFPSRRVLTVAGEAGLRALVQRHHQLLKDSEIGPLFAADEAQFARLVAHIADYVVEICGGPALFTPVRGAMCMRTRHFPFLIDERARTVWLEQLWQAMQDTGFPDEVCEEYWNWLEPFSLRLINRRTTKEQPARYPYQPVTAG